MSKIESDENNPRLFEEEEDGEALPESKESQKEQLKDNEEECNDHKKILSPEDIIDQRNYFQRTCGKMEEGSERGGIFALSSLALGTGCLSLPTRAAQFGCIWFMITLVVGAYASYWTLKVMVRAARTVRGNDYSISVKKISGTVLGIIIDIILMIYLFGVMTSYQVIIFSLIGRTYFDIFVDKEKYNNSFDIYEKEIWDKNKIKFPIMFITVGIILPLCLLKNISKMRFASMFAIVALIYTILVVIIESPFYWKHYKENDYDENDLNTHPNWFEIGKSFKGDANFFSCVSTIFFTYSCHPGAFSVYKTLKNNTDKRINKVFRRSILLDMVIYLSITICGFLTTPIKTGSLIIFRESIFKNDIFMRIAQVAVALELYLSLPANLASLRNSFLLLLFGNDNLSNSKNYLITIPVMLLSTLLGALYKDILAYISLLGGFFSSIFCFLVPGMMALQTSEKSLCSFESIMIIIFISILTTLGFLGGIQTIKASL